MYFQYQQSLPPDTLLVGTPDPADLVSISQVPTHTFKKNPLLLFLIIMFLLQKLLLIWLTCYLAVPMLCI